MVFSVQTFFLYPEAFHQQRVSSLIAPDAWFWCIARKRGIEVHQLNLIFYVDEAKMPTPNNLNLIEITFDSLFSCISLMINAGFFNQSIFYVVCLKPNALSLVTVKQQWRLH